MIVHETLLQMTNFRYKCDVTYRVHVLCVQR